MHLEKRENGMKIASRFNDYEVRFFNRLQDALSDLEEGDNLLFVIDEKILELYPNAFITLQKKFPILPVNASEDLKTLSGVEHLSKWLNSFGATKASTLVGVGGGTIQDLVSFTAHVYHRGIAWVFLPTTLMAQADSCIGSKSGINVLPSKNQIGAVHAPARVQICEEFLDSLPDVEKEAGFGEILKLSLTSSHHFFDELTVVENEPQVTSSTLGALVYKSLLCKKEIIEQDEYESDIRRILNFGHTFGHALEACTNYSVPHGIAVVWGIDVINSLGVLRGFTPKSLSKRVREFSDAFFNFKIRELPDSSSLLAHVALDKKVTGNLLSAIFLEGPGVLRIRDIEINDSFKSDIDTVLAGNVIFSCA